MSVSNIALRGVYGLLKGENKTGRKEEAWLVVGKDTLLERMTSWHLGRPRWPGIRNALTLTPPLFEDEYITITTYHTIEAIEAMFVLASYSMPYTVRNIMSYRQSLEE